jgi:hypothetical protein
LTRHRFYGKVNLTGNLLKEVILLKALSIMTILLCTMLFMGCADMDKRITALEQRMDKVDAAADRAEAAAQKCEKSFEMQQMK